MKRFLSIGILILTAVVVNAQDAADKINQANEAMQAKDYAKAFELYEGAMNNLGDVQVPDAINYNIGLAAYNSDNFEKAIEYLDKAIAAEANVAKSHDYKARSYNKLKDYPNTVASYEAAIAASDGDSKTLKYNAGIAAYRGEIFDKAISYFSQSVELGYKAETAQYYKAVVCNKQGDKAGYKQALVEGAEKFPTDNKIGAALAKLYVSEGNGLYKKGVAVLNAANEKVNGGAMKTTDAEYTAEVEKVKVEFQAASEVLEKAVQLDASNENASKLLDACKQSLTI
ncbi:MAG: tetratricopeptide repeat protein [Mariniphaga sp.]|nr:tetratricopeptide repeat protein [Mariniphaga sp.]